jgi:hypothetical protein
MGSNRIMFDELCHRTTQFILFCLSHHNCDSIVNNIVRNSLFFCRNLSPIGRNYFLVCRRYDSNPNHSLIRDPDNCRTIMSCLSHCCGNKFYIEYSPSFFCLVETLLLRNNFLNFDLVYESLRMLDMDVRTT